MITGGYQLNYFPAQPGADWALIVPGGGYWGWMDISEGKPIARYLNDRGIAAFILRYRLRSFGLTKRLPLRDVQRAIAEILAPDAPYDVNRRHWSIWGASAGGHLAGEYVAAALRDGAPLPEALVLLYPVVTMARFTNKLTRLALLGPCPSVATRREHSVDQQITSHWPPTFLAASEQDGLVPYQNSLLMMRAIKNQGGQARMRLYHQGHHGVGLGLDTPLAGWADAALAYWRAHRR